MSTVQPLRVFMGYDAREDEAYQVAQFSIVRRSSKPVLVTPIELGQLRDSGILDRPIDERDGRLWCPVSGAPMATEFACSRFVVPLFQKDGWALFVDCDVLCLADIAELFALADERYAVMVVKHPDMEMRAEKMDGQVQTHYKRKNWSSVMLFNCSHPSNRRVTRELLETWPGRFLHQFRWLDDEEIGELPAEWNHLVGEQGPGHFAALLHYTLGYPLLPGCENSDHATEWNRERAMLCCRKNQ
jgi:hypothetical protein